MVNNRVNVSAYSGLPPIEVSSDTIYIEDGPLYDVEKVLQLLTEGDEKTIPWTRKCKTDLQKWSLDKEDARQIVKDAISQQEGTYLNSQWCVQNPTGPWAGCDSYKLVRDEWVEYAHKYMRFEYYVKFAIGKTGKILLLVSCHLSQ
ncbi:MAG: hypothetical protein ACI9LM_003336 [Alteromonadaceae bacterium]|jgi:hypothetical protein